MLKKAFIFLLLLVAGVYAQNGNQEVSSQFKRGLDFYLINGFGVAYKFGGCTTVGYRLQVDAGLGLSNGTRDQNENNQNSSYSYQSKGDDDHFSFNVRLFPQIYFNLFSSERIAVNYGFGPLFKYSYYKNSSDNHNLTNNSGMQQENNSGWNKENDYYLGAGAFVCVEAKITGYLSLFAESSVGAGRSWEYSKNNSTGPGYNQTYTYNYYRWSISLENIRIGASIYF